MTADELRAWRAAHGISQEQLARLLGVTSTAVRRWEMPEESAHRRAIPPYLERALRDIARERAHSLRRAPIRSTPK